MITITKDKNIFKIEVSGTNGFYALDVNNGSFLGKKGAPLKVYPMAMSDLANAFHRLNTTLGIVIHNILYYKTYNRSTAYLSYDDSLAAMKVADKIDSLNIFLNYSIDQLNIVERNYKYFIKYVKECGGTLNLQQKNNFFTWLSLEKQKSQLGKVADSITPEMFNAMTNSGRLEFTSEEWEVIAYYLIRGKYWEYHNHSCNTLRHYLEFCRLINKKPEKQNNFMREYIETQKEYELRKREFDNAKLVANYKAKEKAFTFTFGKYSIVVPTSMEDIIEEGRNMHHCVGGYADSVVAGDTFIVFVRETNTPKECYITAQVHTDGRLGQYYLAYDKYISSAEDTAFYNAFAKHLRENWK